MKHSAERYGHHAYTQNEIKKVSSSIPHINEPPLCRADRDVINKYKITTPISNFSTDLDSYQGALNSLALSLTIY